MSTKLIDITKQLKAFFSSSELSISLKETNGISGISIIEAHIQKRHLETSTSGIISLAECSDNQYNCINIVHVAVAERSRRKGLFSDFLLLLEEFDYGDFLAAGTNLYVRIDKVMNPVLDECLPKKGYSRVRSGDESHFSYQKIIRHNKDLRTGRQPEVDNWLVLAAMPGIRNREELYTDHS